MAGGQHGNDVGDGIMRGVAGCGRMPGVVKEHIGPRVDWRDVRACLEIAGMWNRIT